MPALFPCASCGRHVRNLDLTCPFCSASQPPGRAAAEAPSPRAKRAVAFVATSLAVAACAQTPGAKPGPDNVSVPAATGSTPASTATASAAPTASPPTATATATAAPTATATVAPGPQRPLAPQTRYGLPPFLADDELV
jgi:hypothetical protein